MDQLKNYQPAQIVRSEQPSTSTVNTAYTVYTTTTNTTTSSGGTDATNTLGACYTSTKGIAY